jgi:hypothetical protein
MHTLAAHLATASLLAARHAGYQGTVASAKSAAKPVSAVVLAAVVVTVTIVRIIVKTLRTMIGHMLEYSIRVVTTLTSYAFTALVMVVIGVVLLTRH